MEIKVIPINISQIPEILRDIILQPESDKYRNLVIYVEKYEEEDGKFYPRILSRSSVDKIKLVGALELAKLGVSKIETWEDLCDTEE